MAQTQTKSGNASSIVGPIWICRLHSTSHVVQVIKSDRRNTKKGPASGKKGGTNGATSSNKTDGKSTKPRNTGQKCGNCGYAPHTCTDQCPARAKLCGNCGKKNHFAALCRQKTVHTVEDANIDSDEGKDFYIECVHSTTHKDQAFVELTCNGTKMPFKIQTCCPNLTLTS